MRGKVREGDREVGGEGKAGQFRVKGRGGEMRGVEEDRWRGERRGRWERSIERERWWVKGGIG